MVGPESTVGLDSTVSPASARAPAKSAQPEQSASTAEPLSISRQIALPDDAELPEAPETAADQPALPTTGPDEARPVIGAALAPAPHTEAPAPHTEAPAPRTEASAPRTEAPRTEAPRTEAPARRTQAPGPRTEVSEPQEEAFTLSESADREPVRLETNRPHITVVNAGATAEPAPTVERMLAGPSVRRGDGISGRVMVVPGGHRPGKPDQLQRDRARAQLPIAGPRRVIVLGCTVGAGQTITALLTGEVLASLRSEPIAAFDLNVGANSLARRARLRPALAQATSLGPPRLEVLHPLAESESDPADPAAGLARAARLFEQATAEHQIVLADPSTTVVPRLLSMADQLILVAPASAAASRAIGMTFEWLDAHGHAELASDAIMVMNGVSRRSTAHVEQAERGCIGRCRAIVRVPWDDQLGVQSAKRERAAASEKPTSQWAGTVSPATAGAYTALAGVLVVALADHAGPDPGQGDGSHPGRPANASAGKTRGSGWGPR